LTHRRVCPKKQIQRLLFFNFKDLENCAPFYLVQGKSNFNHQMSAKKNSPNYNAGSPGLTGCTVNSISSMAHRWSLFHVYFVNGEEICSPFSCATSPIFNKNEIGELYNTASGNSKLPIFAMDIIMD